MDAISARGMIKRAFRRRRRRRASTAATTRSDLRLGVSRLAGMVGASEGRIRCVAGDKAVRYFRERNRQGEASFVRT